MNIKETPNPIGTPVENYYINIFVESMKVVWDTTKKKTRWWKFWEKVKLTTVTNFLLNCLDDLIAYVDQMENVCGADKKATVLFAIGKIYDYVIKEAMPIAMWPFANVIRSYIIDTLISNSIDWIVAKYRDGNFKSKSPEQLETKWVFCTIK